MNTLAKTLHGSRLYGLENAKSDWDRKAIHLPTHEECFLLKAPRNVHTEDIVDGVKHEAESFSLQEAITLASRGEDCLISMLHCSDHHVIVDSPIFATLRRERARFYTKSMAGMAGYCRGMAARYALRADRMETVELVILALQHMVDAGIAKLGQAWDLLPDIQHTRRFENATDRGLDKRTYEVVGKGLPATIAPQYALDIMIKVRDTFGARVKAARNMQGVDTKAVSHSFRVAYQLKHLFTEGDFSFPLPESTFIRAVKEGTLNYVTDGLDTKLNDLITEVEALSAASSFPERVDTAWMDDFVINAYSL